MSKKLTTTIARALAEKVRAELVARNKDTATTLKKKVESSKEFKELTKIMAQVNDLEKRKAELRDYLNHQFSTKVADVSVSLYNSVPSVYVREQSSASVDNIKDLILIEDYMSDSTTESAEDLIKRIADKLCS